MESRIVAYPLTHTVHVDLTCPIPVHDLPDTDDQACPPLAPCCNVCGSSENLVFVGSTHALADAWHTVLNSDPLVDSDEECPDEHLRVDYSRSFAAHRTRECSSEDCR
jgi:hypothetical protein